LAKPKEYINSKGKRVTYARITPYTDENGKERQDIIKMFKEMEPLDYESAGKLAETVGVSRKSIIAKAQSLGLTYLTERQKVNTGTETIGSFHDFENLLDEMNRG